MFSYLPYIGYVIEESGFSIWHSHVGILDVSVSVFPLHSSAPQCRDNPFLPDELGSYMLNDKDERKIGLYNSCIWRIYFQEKDEYLSCHLPSGIYFPDLIHIFLKNGIFIMIHIFTV